MGRTAYIEMLLRKARCSKELALCIMSATMIAYLNGACTMGKKAKKSKKASRQSSEDESPAQAFERLGNGRVNNALKFIRLTGQLVGPGYESSEEQRASIVTVLEEAVQKLKDVFAGKGKASDSFKLPS